MEKQLENLLMTKFPEYLGNLSDQNGYINCEKGWFVPIYQFLQEMKMNGFVFEIACLKEKWGSLRIYPHLRHYPFTDEPSPAPLPEKVWEAFRVLQRRSATICELCGQPGELRWEWCWIRTLCDSCNATYDKCTTRRTIEYQDWKPGRGQMILPKEIREQLAPPKL